jgi:filamentous hemagglutinin family protein
MSVQPFHGLVRYVLIPSALSLSFFWQLKAQAQIVPDNSLGSNGSIVDANGRITGGVKFSQGSGLFHSFGEFNIAPNSAGIFANPVGVDNIFARVTGGNSSNINGVLSVEGNANLYLINPNGVAFGGGAYLDLRGSLVVSTANGIEFGNNGGVFSAANPQVPLLTMQVPVGLQMGNRPKPIELKDVRLSLVSLDSTQTSQNLLIVGGDISLNNSIIEVRKNQSNLEIAGISSAGTVKLGSGRELLVLPENIERSNVYIQNNSSIYNFSMFTGDIRIQANNIEITNFSNQPNSSSRVLNQSYGSGWIGKSGDVIIDSTGNVVINGGGELNARSTGFAANITAESSLTGGDIKIKAVNLSILEGGIVLVVPSPGSTTNGGNVAIQVKDTVLIAAPETHIEGGIYSGALGSGNAGDLNISTKKLVIRNSGQLSADNSSGDVRYPNGTGNAGNIYINASDSVEVVGVRYFIDGKVPKPTGIATFTSTVGSAGNINILTPQLSVIDGASITSSTAGGRAGSINISGNNGGQSDVVKLTGSDIQENASRIRSVTRTANNAGAININSKTLLLLEATRIDSRTDGSTSSGNSGDITINASVVRATGGSQIISTTDGIGNAGKIEVNANEAIDFSGFDPLFDQRNDQNRPYKLERVQQNIDPYSGANSQATPNSSGRGGDVILNTPRLNVSDQARLTVEGKGSGNGGNINANSDKILLDRGSIIAKTTSANGGNILLSPLSLLFLRNQSEISASAAAGGNGGNVNIQSPNSLIVAIPNENSDITANAIGGQGGRVNVEVFNTFGFSNSVNFPGLSNITASSAQGAQGTVTINTPGTNPDQGLEPLPIEPRSPDFSASCRPGSTQVTNSLVDSGRGGTPVNPGETLSALSTWSDDRYRSENPPTPSNTSEIIEAQGWVRGKNRTVVLTTRSNAQNRQITLKVKDNQNCYEH